MDIWIQMQADQIMNKRKNGYFIVYVKNTRDFSHEMNGLQFEMKKRMLY